MPMPGVHKQINQTAHCSLFLEFCGGARHSRRRWLSKIVRRFKKGVSVATEFEKCKEALDQITQKLPDFIDPDLKELPSLLPFKAICLNSMLIHRVTHLVGESLCLHEQHSVLPSLMVVRAAIETTALLYMLNNKIEQAIKKNETEDLETFIEKATIGSRNDDTEIDSVNILTAIKHISKRYPEYLKFYEVLSEYCHPNYAGLLGSYSKLNEEKTVLILGPSGDYGITCVSQGVKSALDLGATSDTLNLCHVHYA
jgi:hypothetical protein